MHPRESWAMRKLWPLVFLSLLAPLACAAAIDELAEAIVLTPQGGATVEDAEIARCQQRAGAAGAKPETFERLGWALR